MLPILRSSVACLSTILQAAHEKVYNTTMHNILEHAALNWVAKGIETIYCQWIQGIVSF